MDLRVAFVTVCLCALAITSTEAAIPKCCITTKNFIPKRVLRKVQGWEMQENSGACDIRALKLRVKGMRRPICANPKLKDQILVAIKRNKQKAKL